MKQKLMYDNKGRGLFPTWKSPPPPPLLPSPSSVLFYLEALLTTCSLHRLAACGRPPQSWKTFPTPLPPTPSSALLATTCSLTQARVDSPQTRAYASTSNEYR